MQGKPSTGPQRGPRLTKERNRGFTSYARKASEPILDFQVLIPSTVKLRVEGMQKMNSHYRDTRRLCLLWLQNREEYWDWTGSYHVAQASLSLCHLLFSAPEYLEYRFDLLCFSNGYSFPPPSFQWWELNSDLMHTRRATCILP